MSNLASANSKIQSEATRFRSAVSESLIQALGANINYLLDALLPVGSVIETYLTEAQFQAQSSASWILSDGRNVSGSLYTLVTGFTTVPDRRGIVAVGKNNGRSTGTGNTGGDLALGTYEADANKTHTHLGHNGTGFTFLSETGGPIVHDDGSEIAINQQADAGNGTADGSEARPRRITANFMIRIN